MTASSSDPGPYPSEQYFYKVDLEQVESSIKVLAASWTAERIVEEAKELAKQGK